MSVPVINEITRTERWIRTVLVANPSIAAIVTNGDGTFRVHSGVMPQEVNVYPAIVYSWDSAPDDTETGGPNRVWARNRYLIKGITQARSVLGLQTLMDLVDQELYGARGGVTGASIDYCRRIRPFRQVTIENNQQFHHVGAIWEIAVGAR